MTRASRCATAAFAGLLGIVALSGPAALLALPEAHAPGAPVLAVAPPWADLPAIAEEAGGRPIGPFAAPFAMLAVGSDPSFPARLRAAGAWLALDGRRVAQLCGAAG